MARVGKSEGPGSRMQGGEMACGSLPIGLQVLPELFLAVSTVLPILCPSIFVTGSSRHR